MASERRKQRPRRPPPEASASGGPTPGRYHVELKPAAERDLGALDKEARVRVARKIDALAHNPRPPGVEKLKGADDLWRVRVGNYRVVYTVKDQVLLVLVVHLGHRREVYRGNR